MIQYIKRPHTTIFTGPTGCGKTHLVLELIEKEYKKHFDYIIKTATQYAPDLMMKKPHTINE